MAIRYGDRIRVSTSVNTWIPKPFNPIQLKPYLWLDASLASTITESSGSISQWNDISGNGRHVSQASGTAQPSYQTAIQNGLNVVRFDGSNDFLSRANFVSSATFTFFIAADINTDGMVWETNLDGGNQVYWYSTTGSSAFVRVGNVATVSRNVTTSYLTRTVWIASGVTCDATSGNLIFFGDKTGNTIPVAGTTTGTGTFTATLTLGGRNGSLNMSADWGEFIMFDRFVNRTERGQVMDYLNAKWAIS